MTTQHATRPHAGNDFGNLLKHWRESRRLSQLDLALEANVSSKHVSFLETGRNRPSREMILRLSQAMDVPLRDRNLLLNCAGFTPAYHESPLDAPSIDLANEAISRILDKQEPYPAIVVDGGWTLVRQNKSALALADILFPGATTTGLNALELLFSDKGLQPFIVNWDELSATILIRLYRETLGQSARDDSRALLDKLLALPSTPANWQDIASRLPAGPTVDMVLRKDDLQMSFFSTVTTFGTAQDVTLQELRIESWFPSDAATRSLCESW